MDEQRQTSSGVYLSLGSNMGDKAENLRTALEKLAPGVDVRKVSPVYETEPKHVLHQPHFLNIVCEGNTKLPARALLTFVKGIEKDLGRVGTERFGPRAIDIDILFYGKISLNEADLVIPHPRMALRAFVLAPLSDIAPDFVHPLLGSPISKLLKALPDASTDVKKTSIVL